MWRGRDNQKTQENKQGHSKKWHILRSFQWSSEDLLSNLHHTPEVTGGTNPVKIWGDSFPGIGRTGAKSPSQDQGWDSLGREGLGKLGKGESQAALGAVVPESHFTCWGRHKSLTVFGFLNTKPHSFTFKHDSSLPIPTPSFPPISGIWHKIMI